MTRPQLFLLCLCLAWGSAEDAAAARIRIVVESPAGIQQKVYVARPVGLATDRPVVFVMHGVRRNADEYCDQWYELAEENGLLVVVPEFSKRDFPGADAYNLGNVFDADGKLRPRQAWAFSAIEPIFDAVRRRFGMTAERYSIYGHSAGAQFVHRFVYYVPEARIQQAVAANAGWYTMPDFTIDFPYGLRGAAVGEPLLRQALTLPLMVLLGEDDTDPDHPSLRRSPEAMAQGDDRFARGQAFYSAAKLAAEKLQVPFSWQLATVPGADHDNRLMAPAAVPYLIP